MNQPPPPDSNPQPPTSKPSIRQQAENSSMGGGMQAAQGNNNIQNQGNNNWLGNTWNIFLGRPSVAPVGNPARPENQRLLLAAVKHEVNARLESSLYNAVLINLGKQVQPEQVKRSWDAEIKIGSKPSELLPPKMSIMQVFDRMDIAGRLLILGEPGSGKTTTMLDLARELIQKAEANANYPIPVLFNLSSWKNPRQPMKDWLVEELKSKYGVRKDIGKKWLGDKQLLPLLDGLDEVKPEYQASCVQSLNQWLQSEFRPQYLLMCSRREEYEKVIRGRWQEAETLEEEADNLQEETRFHLNGAILLKALTDGQIQQYLASVNLAELWQVLQPDKPLLQLMRTPLFLSVLIFILLHDEKFDCQEWQRLISTKARLQYLFDAYWEAAMKRDLVNPQQKDIGIKSRAYGKRKPPSAWQTRQMLVYLAQQLQRESQTEFLIEKMQPTWLQTRFHKQIYRIGIIQIFGLIAGLGTTGLLSGLTTELSASQFRFGLSFGVSTGLVFGLRSGLSEEIKPVESLKWSWVNARKGLRGGLIDGMIFGMIFRLVDGLLERLINSVHLDFVLSFQLLMFIGLVVGLSVGLSTGLSAGLSGPDIEVESRTVPNQGIRKSAANAGVFMLIILLVGGLIGGLIGGLLFGLVAVLMSPAPSTKQQIVGLIGGMVIGLIFGLVAGLAFGLIAVLNGSAGRACIQHFMLRAVLWHNNYIPWNYARFLDYATERMFLQRVGGRYRFIHKLLQDYFAQMPLDTFK